MAYTDKVKELRYLASRPGYMKLRSREGREIIAAFKNKPCMDCDQNFPSVCMHFDHILERGPKLFPVSWGSCASRETLLAEIAKCDVVCANCHAIRTQERRKAVSES